MGDLYRAYLKHCLADKSLSKEEVNALAHLKRIFQLNDRAVGSIHHEVGRAVYEEAVAGVIADGKLEEDEKAFLEKLKRELTLSDDIATRIYADLAKQFVQKVLESSIADQKLSPEEDTELRAIAKNLGVEIVLEDKTKALLDKYRLFWLVENGEIPTVPVEINLQRNERCYFVTNVDWHEHRTVTRRIRYGGPTYRLKIVKGLYWRMGDLAVQRVTEDVLEHIDSGRLFLPSKRLIFIGERKNTSIALSKILDFILYKNGVEIEKAAGKSPFLVFAYNLDVFAVILAKAIEDAQ